MLRKFLFVLLLICTLPIFAEDAAPPAPARGDISGTVLDVNGGVVPGAAVVIRCQLPCSEQSKVAGDMGDFDFRNLDLQVPYTVSVSATGFKEWTSQPIVLTPDQSVILLTDVRIAITEAAESVTVYANTEQIAAEQVQIEEQQRVLGIIPNFYVVYDSKNAVPLSAKLKFKLAMRVSVDPVTVAGVGLMAGMQQAGSTPNYVEGAKGFGQRFGAEAATGFSGILIGGAVLPSLLHQDPRYFYQGTGTTSSRLRHALFSPFICRGDNGRQQFNFSSLGGDLASSALTSTYYPDSNRGASVVFGSFALGTGERMVGAVVQEFVLNKLTQRARKSE